MFTQWFLPFLLGGIGAAIGAGLGIFNTVNQANTTATNNRISEEQNKLQKEAFEHNKEMNQWQREFAEKQFTYQAQQNDLTRQREDNAVQRRAADLEAAGMSKTLAAGSAAQASVTGTAGSSSANSVQAPQLSKREAWRVEQINAIGTALSIANAYEDIKVKRANNRAKDAEIIETLSNAGLLDEKQKTEAVDRLLKQSGTRYNNAKAASEEYNLNYSKNRNMRTTDNTDTKYNTGKSALGDIQEAGKYLAERSPNPPVDKSQEQIDYLNKQIRVMFSRNTKYDDIVAKLWDQIPGYNKKMKLEYVIGVLTNEGSSAGKSSWK